MGKKKQRYSLADEKEGKHNKETEEAARALDECIVYNICMHGFEDQRLALSKYISLA